MPWLPAEATRFDKKATGAHGVRWAKIANAVLKATGSESKAIRVASGVLKHHYKKAKKS